MELTEDDLQDSYDDISRRRLNGYLNKFFATIFGLSVFLSMFFVADFIYRNEFISDFYISLTIFLGSLVAVLILSPRQKIFKIDKHYILFLDFYESFSTLKDLEKSYRKNRTDRILDDKKKAKKGLRVLVDTIDEWIISGMPIAMKELPESLSKNLREKIIPMIDQNNKEQFYEFFKNMKGECELMYKREPTLEEWIIFNERLNSIQIIIKEKITEKEHRIPVFLLRPYIAAPIIWIIFFSLLLYEKPESFVVPLAVITAGSFGAATFFSTEYVRKIVTKYEKKHVPEFNK